MAWNTPASYSVGQKLAAANLNTYLRDNMNAVHDLAAGVYTSSTRPASPTEGMLIWELDTHRLMEYTTPTTGWRPPWNLPWGVQGYGLDITPRNCNTSSGTPSAVFPTTTYTPLTGRLVRVTWSAAMVYNNHAGTNECYASVADQAGVIQQNINERQFGGIGDFDSMGGSIVAAWTTGALTGLQIRANCTQATAVTFQYGTYAAYLVIEDIGPSSAPP